MPIFLQFQCHLPVSAIQIRLLIKKICCAIQDIHHGNSKPVKRCKPLWSCTVICTRMCMATWHNSCRKAPANIWPRQHGKMHKKNSNFKMWYTSGTLRQNKSPDSLYLQGFPGFCQLFEFANEILLLYIFVSALWFYLVLYVFHCPKSIDCTERCYQFVIKSLLSVKDSRNILISVDHTIDLYILAARLVDNHIVLPYRIFVICPKTDSFGKL